MKWFNSTHKDNNMSANRAIHDDNLLDLELDEIAVADAR